MMVTSEGKELCQIRNATTLLASPMVVTQVLPTAKMVISVPPR